MKQRGIIILFSGPSGVGKGTIIKELLKDNDLNLVYSISTTTREPRENEINGKDYFFVDKEEFKKRIKHKKFLEWAKFATSYYGTEKDNVYRELKRGKNVLLEIETVGAMIVMNKLFSTDYISIFIEPPSLKSLEDRLRNRSTESENLIHKRLYKAKRELKLARKYKHRIINDNLEEAIKKVKEIIIKETEN